MQSSKMRYLLPFLLLLIFSSTTTAQGVLSFEDVMKFEDIGEIQLSDNGEWVAYEVWPDRGDGRVEVKSINGRQTYQMSLGASPKITPNGNWVAAFRKVPLAEQLKESKEKPQQGLLLLNTANGETIEFDSVQTFQYSENGNWLAVHHLQQKEIEDLKFKNKNLGSELQLRNLVTGNEINIPFVHEMAFDSLGQYLTYSVVDTSSVNNGLYVVDLAEEVTRTIEAEENTYYSNLTWDFDTERLAFTKANYDTSFVYDDASLHIWDAPEDELSIIVSSDEAKDGYSLRSNNKLEFTNDGKRLFFGFMDADMAKMVAEKEEDVQEEINIYDVDEIVEERGLDIWHGDDPRIKTHEKKTWESRKNHLYTAVYHFEDEEWIQLADHDMEDIRVAQNPKVVLGSSQKPYLKEMTWEGFFNDWYYVDLETGERSIIAEKLSEGAYLSPGGNYVAYYYDMNWHLLDIENGKTQNLTVDLEVPFFNEDHDYPSRVPDYGIAGWVEEDQAVLIYDKFDIWKFPTDLSDPVNLTNGEGRKSNRIFRLERMNKEWNEPYGNKESLLLTSYHDLKKNFGFYEASVDKPGVKRLLEEDKKFTFVKIAEDAKTVLYKREAYDEFPNIWVSNDWKFKRTEKLTHLHEDLKEKWNWGHAELIDWRSVDGKFIQGIVIKPDNYDPNKRYPIMTYYYRFFTDRLHDFNEPKTNHRPVFAQYVSDGYVVFLPDIRFEVGRPGFAATKSLVPGIQKLIEMDIADEDKLGLHGHSWSGYQTAFMVTQTDIFDAAVSGAPVSNMTSAYSGIRWGSGLARQFQYEKTQSRIGATLVEAPLKYIENSPVFYADKITTPMLIMHGDADGAVPWYQSIELYLAMRRYNKDVVFLQYHDEPHHPQKFSNKLDYAIRMKEYFDYYLKGIGEPDWILEGEAYVGN